MITFELYIGSDEKVYLVYEAKDGDVFSTTLLKAVKEIQEELEQAVFGNKSEPSFLNRHIPN